MLNHRWAKGGLVFLTFIFFMVYVLEIEAFARVGGGRSSGSRGSRSYSAPRTTTPSPVQPSPSKQYTQPARPPVAQPVPQAQGGFMRSLAGGIIGGMIGGMLFRSLGFAGGSGGMGGGIGLMDIVLIALILYAIYWFIKKKRREAETGAYYRETGAAGYDQPSSAPAYGEQEDDREKGLSHIRQMDAYFDEKKFTDMSMDYFFRIQGAWTSRDMAPARTMLTEEMFTALEGDAQNLKTARRINKLENIAVRSADITEAWQEGGRDFITVRFYANLLDYSVDEGTGQVVEGSKTDPVKFEEYWTFTRLVGGSLWQLSAITQSQ